jgi:hypothetical protein
MPIVAGWVGLVGTIAAVIAAIVGVCLLVVTLKDRGRPVRVTVSTRESDKGGNTELHWEASMGNGRSLVLHRFGVLVEGEPEPWYLPVNPMLGRQLPAPLAANDRLRVGTYDVELYGKLVTSNRGARDVSLVAFFEDGGGTKYEGSRLLANATTRKLVVESALPR